MRRLFCSLILLVAAGTACGDGGTGPKGSLTGTYALSTVDSRSLPIVFYEDADYKVEILSGSFAVTGASTFTETIAVRETDSTGPLVTTAVCAGTYTRSGNSLTLTEPETNECGGTYSAAWNGSNTLSVDYGGVVAVYKR